MAQINTLTPKGRNTVFSLVLGGFERVQKESPVDSLLTASIGLGDSAKLRVAWGHDFGDFKSESRR